MKKRSLLMLAVLFSSFAAYGMESKNKAKAKAASTLTDKDVDDILESCGVIASQEVASSSASSSTSSRSETASTNAQPAVTPYTRYYFNSDIKGAFLNCIANEQEAVRGAFYRFTLYGAAEAIVKGIKERNITAKIVVDGEHTSKDFCSPLKLIIQGGGKVFQVSKSRFTDKPGKFEIMHHKFMIFRSNIDGKKLLWTGSWNATGQASDKNSENVMIINDQDAIAKFEEEMIALKGISTALTPQTCVSLKDTDPAINFARRMNGIPELK